MTSLQTLTKAVESLASSAKAARQLMVSVYGDDSITGADVAYVAGYIGAMSAVAERAQAAVHMFAHGVELRAAVKEVLESLDDGVEEADD